jgi:thioester reductase-like protein
MAFDLSVAQIWGCLAAGARMALATDVTRQDPSQLARFIRDAVVTITYFPSTQFATILEHGRDELIACDKYRRAIFAGEYLPIRLVKAIYDLKTPLKVINQWGPTETTIQTSFHEAAYPTDLDLNLPIGFPLMNCSHYVVDSSLKPTPAGVVGELCIGGPQVGHGYLNLPHITEQNFLEDSFATEPFLSRGWTRMYRTGDKGRFLVDGQIDFKGRVSGDRQIKLRGLRIDLAEIEHEIHFASAALKKHPPLADVAVLLKGPDNNGASHWTDERRLVSFLVPGKNSKISRSEQQEVVDHLHKTIRKSLNNYMLPNEYMFVPSLSNLVSSKIDRKWLLSLDHELINPSSATSVPEANGVEKSSEEEDVLNSVKETFRTVLKMPGIRQIGAEDSFFDIGGSSLLMLRLRATLKRRLEMDIPLTTLFQLSTPTAITKTIIDRRYDKESQATEINWDEEATLPNESHYFPSSAEIDPRSEVKDILLTGADSPQGLEILASLTKAWPSATFHLVGTQSLIQEANLSASFKPSHSGAELPSSRIRIVEGTLTQPNFGLNEETFKSLAKTIQIIYHTGVETSLLKSYQDLKNINVKRTLDIIKFSSLATHPTPIHYLSTWSVTHLQKTTGTTLPTSGIDLSESPASFKLSPGPELGYFKSRFVAEKLLCQAAERGFPVTIYRASALLPRLSGKTTTVAADNFALGMVRATLELAVVPDIAFEEPPFSIDFVPADYIASLLARLSLSRSRQDAGGEWKAQYFHIGNPTPLKLRDLPAVLREVHEGEGVGRILGVGEWIELMGKRMKVGNEGEAQVELKVLEEYVSVGHSMFSLDDRETRKVLEGEKEDDKQRVGSVECPPVDADFIRSLLREE